MRRSISHACRHARFLRTDTRVSGVDLPRSPSCAGAQDPLREPADVHLPHRHPRIAFEVEGILPCRAARAGPDAGADSSTRCASDDTRPSDGRSAQCLGLGAARWQLPGRMAVAPEMPGPAPGMATSDLHSIPTLGIGTPPGANHWAARESPVSAGARVLCLGIDAGSRSLIEAWAAAGVLPTFRALMARGLVGDTESVDGFFVGSTWPSFYTGVSPARHGIHSLVQLRPGTYELYRCYTGDFVKREPFWNHLSRAGRRVAICDVPLTGVSKDLNGIQMVEWGSHDANYGFRAWPRSLERDVKARFGVHPQTTSCDVDHRSPEEFVDFTRRLVDGVRKKAALTRH